MNTFKKNKMWIQEIPKIPGKYIVQTKSNILQTTKTIDAILSFDTKGKPHWSFSNQIFYQYLKL